MNKAGVHSGPLWQQSFYDRVIRDEDHLNKTVDYIHHNPVAAGLVTKAQDFRFCSAHAEASTDIEAFFADERRDITDVRVGSSAPRDILRRWSADDAEVKHLGYVAGRSASLRFRPASVLARCWADDAEVKHPGYGVGLRN